MPPTARASVGGMCYHALNRSNRRGAVFHKPGDYDAFVEAIIDARARLPVDLLGYCVMPNHFHFVLTPHQDCDPVRGKQWLLTTRARRHHCHSCTTGHVWQGRFKAFPVRDDDNLVSLLRHVERHALRASLCRGPRTGSGRAYRVGGVPIRCRGRAKSWSAIRSVWSV